MQQDNCSVSDTNRYSHLEIKITGLYSIDSDLTLIEILTTERFLIVKIF